LVRHLSCSRLFWAGAVVALVAAVSATASGSDTTERVSVDSLGGQANDRAGGSVGISADGRFVVFDSYASNLVAGDTNGGSDVFVHDREAGSTERVSVGSSGSQADHDSAISAISADGRYAAFSSFAFNLVPGDTNVRWDVFVHDLQTGATERVSVSTSGEQGNGNSFDMASSADGRFIVFYSYASNLVAGDSNGAADVFVHDRETGATDRVSVNSSGVQGNGDSTAVSISADGRFVAFQSVASNLVPGDTWNGWADVFVHDRQTGSTERVSVDSNGVAGNGQGSGGAALSADGRYAAFFAYSTNLVPNDTNGVADIFVHDRQTALTERVSIDSSGSEANGGSGSFSISGDGRYVSFRSDASNLVLGDANGKADIFVHDRQSGSTVRVGRGRGGGEPNNQSRGSAISADGRYVAFESLASNFVVGDTNGVSDIFVNDKVGTPPTINSFTPASGITGSKVTINGARFDGATSVTFNGKKAKFKVARSGVIQAVVPNSVTTGKITITTPAGTAASADDYVVTFSIATLKPTKGPAGTHVVLMGIGFTDVSSVRFNGALASFTIISANQISAAVPPGATTGKVTATSPQGTVTGPGFRVTA
jgi:hypothetical protein